MKISITIRSGLYEQNPNTIRFHIRIECFNQNKVQNRSKKKKNNKIDNEAAQLKPQYDGDYIGTRTTFLFQNRYSLPNE